MQITTETIIKSLPFDDAFRESLLKSLQRHDPIVKQEITQIIWDTYFALYEATLNQNVELALDRAENDDSTKLDKDFFHTVWTKTDSEMKGELVETTEKVDLTSTRGKLEAIMNLAPQAPSNPPESSKTTD